MQFTALDHELITLIANYLPYRAAIRLALVCKLGRLGVYNNVDFINKREHMILFKDVIDDITARFKHNMLNDNDSTMRVSSLHECGNLRVKYCLISYVYKGITNHGLFCNNINIIINIQDADLNNKVLIDISQWN